MEVCKVSKALELITFIRFKYIILLIISLKNMFYIATTVKNLLGIYLEHTKSYNFDLYVGNVIFIGMNKHIYSNNNSIQTNLLYGL